MLSIEDVNEIDNEFRELAEECDDDRVLDILAVTSDALEYYKLINTEADKLTFGEFTRRYEKAIKELEELVSL